MDEQKLSNELEAFLQNAIKAARYIDLDKHDIAIQAIRKRMTDLESINNRKRLELLEIKSSLDTIQNIVNELQNKLKHLNLIYFNINR